MSKKRGRPKKDIPKEYRLNVRLSIGDASTLKYIIEQTGKNVSEIVRDGIKSEYRKLMKWD